MHERGGGRDRRCFRVKKSVRKKKKDEAILKARRASLLLKEKYHAKRVILFGPIVNDISWEQGDIDLAVCGADGDYTTMMWEVGELVAPFSADIVPMEKLGERVKKRIELEGLEM